MFRIPETGHDGQLVHCLFSMHEDLDLITSTSSKGTCNSSTLEVGTESQIQGYPLGHSEIEVSLNYIKS